MIKVFFHVAAMHHFGAVKDEIFAEMINSGLYHAADKIYVNFAKDEKKLRVKLPEKVELVQESCLKDYEFPTLQLVHDLTGAGDQVLYVHTKGVATPQAHQGGATWRQYMSWGCIHRWRECVKMLEDHDTAGVLLVDKPGMWGPRIGADKFYAGNFWWARGDYVKLLDRPEVSKNRWLCEGWIMSKNPTAGCLHNISNGELVTSLENENMFSFLNICRGDYDARYKHEKRVKSRIEIINRLIKQRGYKSYCEIGIWRGTCFNAVECKRKVSVDPAANPPAIYEMSSDEFFKQTRETFDIFFIDGLHTAEQVEKDIENALKRLNPGGIIVCHDCNPETEHEQRPSEEYDGNGIWVGTVWRAFAKLRMTRPDLRMVVVDTDFGCGLIEPGEQNTYPEHKLTYPFYVQNRKELMNVIDPEEFGQWTKQRT